MAQFYKFDCGCQFEIVGPTPAGSNIPRIRVPVQSINPECPATWKLIGEGRTKGVFQLEKKLGRQWAKTLKPQNIEHLAALGAILRPGAMKSKDAEGVSMTQHYCRRKNGEEPVPNYHPAIDPILVGTYGCLVYQEQCMKITTVVAGFNEQEADMLRKAIGKKLAQEMAKVERMYLEGAIQTNTVSEAQAKELFSWIKESQRYQFNKSHAISYGLVGYISAFFKTHFPVYFFTSWLYHSKDSKVKPHEEKAELINDAQLFGLDILLPSVTVPKKHFSTNGTTIRCGLADIKGLGDVTATKAKRVIRAAEALLDKKIDSFTWYEFLVTCGDLLAANVIEKMISAGACDLFGLSRTRMLHEHSKWKLLKESELDIIYENSVIEKDEPLLFPAETRARLLTNLPDAIKLLIPQVKSCRAEQLESILSSLEHPPHSMDDDPGWVAFTEQSLLGVAFSYSILDSTASHKANCTCKEFMTGHGKPGEYLRLVVQLERVQETKTVKGKNPGSKMAFLTINDGTSSFSDVVIFPDAYTQYGDILEEQNVVVVEGERSRDGGSLIIKKATQI